MENHIMKLNPSPFKMIREGKKTIELRLYDEKRRGIRVGDKITFTNVVTGEKLEKTVVKLHRFVSFKELYASLPLLACGYTASDIDTACADDMNEYYSLEDQEKYGVVGIELG
jgi:ASC-1-like (ASCH) protein